MTRNITAVSTWLVQAVHLMPRTLRMVVNATRRITQKTIPSRWSVAGNPSQPATRSGSHDLAMSDCNASNPRPLMMRWVNSGARASTTFWTLIAPYITLTMGMTR